MNWTVHSLEISNRTQKKEQENRDYELRTQKTEHRKQNTENRKQTTMNWPVHSLKTSIRT